MTIRYMLLISTLAFGLAGAQNEFPLPDFSGYSKTQSFKYFLRWQTDGTEHLQQGNLLTVSAFPRGEGVALQYSVTETGQQSDHRHVYDWAVHASHRKQLSQTELASLRSAIRELPSESNLPPLERLVIVSFRNGREWVTRSYDSRALPTAMRRIYEIIGERFESESAR